MRLPKQVPQRAAFRKKTRAESLAGAAINVDQILREVRDTQRPIEDPRRQFISVKSNYDKLQELGGSADLGVSDLNLAMYCNEYPLDRVRPILARFQKDDVAVRRHWPWGACAISLYVSERRKWSEYDAELPPRGVLGLVGDIEQAAKQLRLGLSSLHEISHRSTDPAAPSHRGHLSWADAYISQAAAGRVSKDVDDSAEALLSAYEGKNALIKRLVEIEAAAKVTAKRVDTKLLIRERGHSDRALPKFVFRCGVVWMSLTGRRPSANKVLPQSGSKDPDFVIFVQELAKLGKVDPPSRAQVHRSLKKLRIEGDQYTLIPIDDDPFDMGGEASAPAEPSSAPAPPIKV